MATTQLPQLTIGEALSSACNKIFQFNGRARRSEYWWTMLVVAIISALTYATGIVPFILELLTIPLTFRRLHDTGRSGWWWGAGIIAYVVLIFIFIVGFLVSAVSSSAFGFSAADVSALMGKALILGGLYVIYRIVLLVFLDRKSVV